MKVIMSPTVYIVYATYKDVQQAREISRAVVSARLAACANILPSHESLYWWEGEVQNASEVAVIYKTTAEAYARLEAEIRRLHSYGTPCIVALPVKEGFPQFLEWVKKEVL